MMVDWIAKTSAGGDKLTELRFNKERLKQLMEAKPIGDTELARRVGVSRTMIFYLKNGKRQTASAEVVSRIADVLNTSVAYLLGENEEDAPKGVLPILIKQLADVASRLPPGRQEELLQIASTLERLEKERGNATPEKMATLLEIEKRLTRQGGNEDLIRALRALLGDPPRRWLIDLGDSPDRSPDDPS